MRFAFFIFTLFPLLGQFYVMWRTWHVLPIGLAYKVILMLIMVFAFGCLFINFSATKERLPIPLTTVLYEVGTSWLIILLYLFMLYLVLDLARLVHLIPSSFLLQNKVTSWGIFAFMLGIFVYGNIHYNHKIRREINLVSEKPLDRSIKMVMMSDLHLGYHNRKAELARWVDKMNAENPDLVLIAGDIIDNSARPLMASNMAEEFRRIKAPVYACLGNHEYYSGEPAAQQFMQDAGIRLLRDSVVLWENAINIAGRDDRTNPRRKEVDVLMKDVDKSKYTILLDHQPYHLELAEQNGVDFQFSGHTHHGQVWPISWITEAIYEDAYGPYQKGKTQYYVSSGIGIWGGKFRIGTCSEYLVVTLRPKQ